MVSTVFAWGALTLRDGQLWLHRKKLESHDDTYDAQVGDYVYVKATNRPVEIFEIAAWRGDLAWLIKVDWLEPWKIDYLRRQVAA